MHHGIASPTRESDLMIRTLALADDRYELHLIFLNNNSSYVNRLKKLANHIAPGRVYFHPPLRPNNIVKGISTFDVGFFPLPSKSFNYKIALPNKLFEFIAAGLAVYIGPSPTMAQVVNDHQCGIVAPSFFPKDLAKILNQTSPESWDKMKKASLVASQKLNADVEMKKLLRLYKEIL